MPELLHLTGMPQATPNTKTKDIPFALSVSERESRSCAWPLMGSPFRFHLVLERRSKSCGWHWLHKARWNRLQLSKFNMFSFRKSNGRT